MIRRVAPVLLAALLAPPAAGGGLDCVAEAPDPRTCIGRMAKTCIAARADGETTLGMVACLDAEAAAWDRMLNAEWAGAMAQARAMDATGDVAGPDLTRADTLRAAQRAWIAFRDADCRAQGARWGTGTLRSVSVANCHLGMTAERALHLRALQED